MSFCTAINCMDGRAQEPVIHYLKNRFHTQYVDMITEPGPNLILALGSDFERMKGLIARCNISVQKHASKGIGVAGHYDCLGNPSSEADQRLHIEEASKLLRNHYGHLPVIGLWLDDQFKVHELPELQRP